MSVCESGRKNYQTETRSIPGKTKGKIRCVIIPASPHHKIISRLAHTSAETLIAPLKQISLPGWDVTSTVDVTRPDYWAKYEKRYNLVFRLRGVNTWWKSFRTTMGCEQGRTQDVPIKIKSVFRSAEAAYYPQVNWEGSAQPEPCSSAAHFRSGVPLGSVLGPLLLSTYSSLINQSVW